MRCTKCGHVMIRFVDGFGQRRVYCRHCYVSYVEDVAVEFGLQRTLKNFAYSNPKAVARVRRWK